MPVKRVFQLNNTPVLQSLLVKLSPPRYNCAQFELAFLRPQSAYQSQEKSGLLQPSSKNQKAPFFDGAVSNLDQQTAEQFAQTVNKLRGKVTILLINQLPKDLQVDEAVVLGKDERHTQSNMPANVMKDKS